MTISLQRQQDQTQIRWLKNKAYVNKEKSIRLFGEYINIGGENKSRDSYRRRIREVRFGYKFLSATLSLREKGE